MHKPKRLPTDTRKKLVTQSEPITIPHHSDEEEIEFLLDADHTEVHLNIESPPSNLILTLSRRTCWLQSGLTLQVCHRDEPLLKPPNNPSNPEVSPMALVSHKLDIKKKALEYQIPMLRAQSTATRFRDMLRNDTIPRGCLPTCKLQLPNPPTSMVTTWNSCLKDCGQQLTLILIDCHLNKFTELQEATDTLVDNAFNNIRAEFTSLP